jgi:hypothetical protein
MTAVLYDGELCFMNIFQGKFFTAAAQTFFPSFLPAKAVPTSPDDPTTQPKQTHVLRTNPNRVPMPTDRTVTATAGSIKKGHRENHIGLWLDKNDPMASDPIEVRSCF